MAFISAVPKLASLDIPRSIAFFEKLGFAKSAHFPDYGIVNKTAFKSTSGYAPTPRYPKQQAVASTFQV